MSTPSAKAPFHGKFLLLSAMVAALFHPSAQAQLERIPQRGNNGDGPRMEGVRIVQPGGLLFATFDSNQDFLITEAEIRAGAMNTFLVADADENGRMTPIEQRAWAARVTSETDVLSNARLCASMLQGFVTAEEFSDCLVTFGERYNDRDEAGAIRVASLTSDFRGGRGPDGPDEKLEPVRRPKVEEPPQFNLD